MPRKDGELTAIKERLRSHAQAFDGLLSLIPAKYYYGEEDTSVCSPVTFHKLTFWDWSQLVFLPLSFIPRTLSDHHPHF